MSEPPPRLPDELLAQTTQMLAPLVRLLMHHGIDHPRLAAALKRVFVDEALADLQRRGEPLPTHTAVSLLTGLQRRDVKALRESGSGRWPAKALAPSLPMQAVTRWASDARYADDDGRPRPLPLRAASAEEPSFEQLSDGLSKDIHPPALRDELVRLGLVHDDGALLTLRQPEFMPSRGAPGQRSGAMARNVHDHLAAAVANLLEERPRFMEYSLVADELRPESAAALQVLARKLWTTAYKRAVQAATEHVERDKALGFSPDAPDTRVRMGIFFYSEPVAANPPAAPRAAEAAPGAEPA